MTRHAWQFCHCDRTGAVNGELLTTHHVTTIWDIREKTRIEYALQVFVYEVRNRKSQIFHCNEGLMLFLQKKFLLFEAPYTKSYVQYYQVLMVFQLFS